MSTQLALTFRDQPANLARVSSKTRSHILHFVSLNAQFHVSEMVEYVESQGVRIAPASCDRILRLMRQNGQFNYRVINRRASLYARLEVSNDKAS